MEIDPSIIDPECRAQLQARYEQERAHMKAVMARHEHEDQKKAAVERLYFKAEGGDRESELLVETLEDARYRSADCD